MTEPGIGLMIVYSIGQFILLNIVIILAETRFHCCSSKSIQPEHLKTIEEQNVSSTDLIELIKYIIGCVYS